MTPPRPDLLTPNARADGTPPPSRRAGVAWRAIVPPGRTAAARHRCGVRLVSVFAAIYRFDVKRSDVYDRLIEGLRMRACVCVIETDDQFFRFRPPAGADYDFAVFLGLAPFDAHCWAVPKDELMRRWADPKTPELVAQHGGSKGKDTAWLSFAHDAPPAWLAPFGGPLRDGLESIARLTDYELRTFGEEE